MCLWLKHLYTRFYTLKFVGYKLLIVRWGTCFKHMVKNQSYLKQAIVLAFFAVFFMNIAASASAQQTTPENKLTIVQTLFNDLQTQNYKDVYAEIDRLKLESQNQEGEAKYNTLLLVLEYHFWLDEGSNIRAIIAELREVILPAEKQVSCDIALNLYAAYADVTEGDYNTGITAIEQALNDAQMAGDELNIALAYEMIGAADAFFGKFYSAIEKLQMSLHRLSGKNDEQADRIRLGIYQTLAYIYTSLDDAQRTVDFYTQSLELSKKHNLAVDVGTIIYNVAFLLLEKQHLDYAEQYFEMLVSYYEEIGDPVNLTYPYYGLAYVYYSRQDYATSKYWAEKANVYGEDIVDFEGTLYQLLAEDEAWLGNVEKAKEYVDLADAYFEKYPEYKGTVWAARSLRARAIIAYGEGQYEDAMQKYDEFHQAYSRASNITFTKDVEALTENLFERLNKERAEGDLLRTNMALESLNLENQRYLSGFIAFLLLVLVGVILFQLRWSKILHKSKLDAENASRSKSDFLAQMSHELRTPLNAIIGFSEMMSKGVLGELNNIKYKEYVVLINQSGLHLLRIINDILDISKVESGKLELVENTFDLCKLIEETVNTMSNRAAREEVNVVYTVPEKCSNLYADRRIIKQILFNILSNAIKFTPAGGDVEIKYNIDDAGEIVVEIKDSGQGMSDADLKQAMEPFGQVKSVLVQSHEGTGLGLPLVKAFMEMHDGKMEITSMPGNGTSVALYIPKQRVC